MTLVAVYKGTRLIGRCDEKCYNAEHPHCDCICGGKNHGVGRRQAEENSRQYIEEWVKDYKDRKGLGADAYHTYDELLFQGNLF